MAFFANDDGDEVKRSAHDSLQNALSSGLDKHKTLAVAVMQDRWIMISESVLLF